MTRYTFGPFKTLKDAEEFKQMLAEKEADSKDAFVTVFVFGQDKKVDDIDDVERKELGIPVKDADVVNVDPVEVEPIAVIDPVVEPNAGVEPVVLDPLVVVDPVVPLVEEGSAVEPVAVNDPVVDPDVEVEPVTVVDPIVPVVEGGAADEPVAVSDSIVEPGAGVDPVVAVDQVVPVVEGESVVAEAPVDEAVMEEVVVSGPCDSDIKDFTWFIGKDLNDKKVYAKLIEFGGNSCADGLEFKVQIGAYRFPENYKWNHLKKYGEPIIVNYPDGITRFTQGTYNTLAVAEELRQKIIKSGQKDAWVTPFYNGKRILLEELFKVNFYGKSIN